MAGTNTTQKVTVDNIDLLSHSKAKQEKQSMLFDQRRIMFTAISTDTHTQQPDKIVAVKFHKRHKVFTVLQCTLVYHYHNFTHEQVTVYSAAC